MWFFITHVVDVLIFMSLLLVIYLLYRFVFFDNEWKRNVWKQQLIQGSKLNRWKELFVNPSNFEEKFRAIGYPFGITVKKYQMARYLLFFILLMQITANVLTGGQTIWLFLPFFWIFLTSQWSPIFDWMYSEFKKNHDDNKNRELYMLYTMISDELKYSPTKRSVYHLIRKLKIHTHSILPAINRGLSESSNGTSVMMRFISDEINTAEAVIVCQMIHDLEKSDSDQIMHLLKSREEAYQVAQSDKRKKKRNTLGHILASLAFAPLMIYLFNVLLVAMGYMNNLQSNIGNFGF